MKKKNPTSQERRRHALDLIGESLYGTRWTVQLAKALEMSSQHIGALHAGKYELTDEVSRKLQEFCKFKALPELKGRYRSVHEALVELALADAMVRADKELAFDNIDSDQDLDAPAQS